MRIPKELKLAILRARILAPDRLPLVLALLEAGYEIHQHNGQKKILGGDAALKKCDRITGWSANDGWLETVDIASLYVCLAAELLIQGDAIEVPNYP